LVNLNNPATMNGFMHETVPIGPFVVSLQLPPGARAMRVRLLEAEQDAKVRREGDRLFVDVPRLRIHEVVAVDLAKLRCFTLLTSLLPCLGDLIAPRMRAAGERVPLDTAQQGHMAVGESLAVATFAVSGAGVWAGPDPGSTAQAGSSSRGCTSLGGTGWTGRWWKPCVASSRLRSSDCLTLCRAARARRRRP
jgi:hypothetical protein